MNLKEYISSGIIESYVMGIATQTEREEFERMCKLHPEITEARTQIELLLQNQIMQNAVSPPVNLKEKIQKKLNDLDSAVETEAIQKKETPVRRLSFWKVVAAASVILLAGAVVWALSVNKKYNEIKESYADLRNKYDQSATQLSELKTDAEMLQKPTVKMAAMQGMSIAPSAFATVYWDTASTNVYLLVNNLPQPPSEKQYQLWALIDNQPLDMGVIDYDYVKQNKLLVKMKNTQNAQAFAITLEPQGGSASPTMQALYVMGKL